MRDAAKKLVHAYDLIARMHGPIPPHIVNPRSREGFEYDVAFGQFVKAFHEGNPLFDPKTMKNPDGSTNFTKTLDMKRASGEPLNDLIEEAAKAEGMSGFRPFDESTRAR